MATLEDQIENFRTQSNVWLEKILQFDDVKSFAGNFNYYHILLAMSNIKNGKFQEAKNNFNTSALIDVLLVEDFNNRLLDFNLPHICYAILSDNEPLIQKYSKLRYSDTIMMRGKETILTMDEMVLRGELPVWCNTIQCLMANNNEGVENNLNIIETKSLKKVSGREEGLKDDYEFYKALHENNKAKMEEVLEKLVSPKIDKKRNKNPILSQYISLPALGYAKLAWRKGIEVEVQSKLVPKELLPIRPLDNYEQLYDFLK